MFEHITTSTVGLAVTQFIEIKCTITRINSNKINTILNKEHQLMQYFLKIKWRFKLKKEILIPCKFIKSQIREILKFQRWEEMWSVWMQFSIIKLTQWIIMDSPKKVGKYLSKKLEFQIPNWFNNRKNIVLN